jgi:hypothetical protein
MTGSFLSVYHAYIALVPGTVHVPAAFHYELYVDVLPAAGHKVLLLEETY